MEEPWRFWSKVRKGDGCWEGQGGRSSNGYGSCLDFSVDIATLEQRYFETGRAGRPTTYAHRLSWRLANGPIPDRMQVDHVCRNRLCVNPVHLELVTQQENLNRRPSVNKALCKHGHPYDRILPSGRKTCLTCARAAAKRFREQHGSNPYRRRHAKPTAQHGTMRCGLQKRSEGSWRHES